MIGHLRSFIFVIPERFAGPHFHFNLICIHIPLLLSLHITDPSNVTFPLFLSSTAIFQAPGDDEGEAASAHSSRSASPDLDHPGGSDQQHSSPRSTRASGSRERGVNGSTGAVVVGTKRESGDQGGRRSKRRKILQNSAGPSSSTTPHGPHYQHGTCLK